MILVERRWGSLDAWPSNRLILIGPLAFLDMTTPPWAEGYVLPVWINGDARASATPMTGARANQKHRDGP